MAESVVTAFFEPIVKRIAIAVRRNVFPSLGITVALTVALVFLLLNPWFGSQRAKFFVVTYMIGGADDIEYILRQTAADSNSGPSLIAGAQRAGFFTASDRSIVDQWSEDFAGKNIVNQRQLGTRYSAILAAREKAETHQPPFQPIGLEGVASSPSCDQTRPTTGQVYVRAGSYLATHLEPGDSLKIIRKDGLGRPVVGTVSKVPDMPKDVDLYLNRVQMIEFLESTAPTIAIRAVVTNDRPNQNTEDKYPSDVNISCRRG